MDVDNVTCLYNHETEYFVQVLGSITNSTQWRVGRKVNVYEDDIEAANWEHGIVS